MSNGTMTAVEKDRLGISEKLIRLSAGLESPSDLCADLKQAAN
jgi:cystathionine gamma-lyase